VTDYSPLDTFRETDAEDDPARSRRIREEFRARIATMAADEEGRRPFDDPVSRAAVAKPRRRPLLALAAMALVLVLAGASAIVLSRSQPPGALDELARSAAKRTDTTLDATQYLYVSERTVAHDSVSQRDQWTSRRGTGQSAITHVTIGPPTTDRPSLALYPAPGSLDFAGMSYDELRSLPTEPSALLDRLLVLGVARGEDPATQAFALAGVLALDVTPPSVASAAIRGLGQLGGTTIGPVPDAAGRTGVGIRGDNGDGTAWLVVVDPASGRALAAHDAIDPARSATTADGRVWLDQEVTADLSPDGSPPTHS
jgi:hypothetical protein